jgi:predicted Zn finger-like uncharacterized protein
MNILCDRCQARFTLPDDKIPAGKTLTLKCPKCENPLQVSAPAARVSAPAVPNGDPDLDNADYGTGGGPFGYIEEGIETALICEQDPEVRERISSLLSAMSYWLTEADDARSALKNMRYHMYDLVIVNEMFSTTNPKSNGVLIFLERQPMSIRRNIFVTLLSRRFRSMDQMMAFNQSVDLIINIENINEFGKILARGLKEKKAFYKVLKDTQKRVGRV